MGWLAGWNRRKLITINGTSAGAQSDYQMKLTVNQSGTTDSPGIISLGGNILPSFNDLRFTKSDGSTLLNYWMESTSGTSPNQVVKVWIRLAPSPDTIPASPGTYSFYIYYDNSSASAASDGTNTFLFFDDFSSTTYTSKWTAINGTWNQTNGYIATTNDPSGTSGSNPIGLRSNSTFNANGGKFYMTFRMRPNSNVAWNTVISTYANATQPGSDELTSGAFGGSVNTYSQSRSMSIVYPGGSSNYTSVHPYGIWYRYEIYYNGALGYNWNVVREDTGGIYYSGSNTPNVSSTSNLYVWLGGDNTDLRWDDIRVRKYTSPEPTWGVVGLEQSITLNISSNPSGGEVWLAYPAGTTWVDQHVTTPTTIYPTQGTGYYDVMIGLGGYQPWTLYNQYYQAGQTYNLAADLIILPGSLSISSTPSGAEIYINNVDQSNTTTPSGTTISNLAPGTYNIKLILAGYKDWTVQATVITNSSTPVSAIFAGSAYIISTPSEAAIYLDGSLTSIGNTSLTITNLTLPSSGATQSHTYILRLTGYADTSGNFTATAGSTITIPVTFPGSLYITSMPTGAQIYIDGVLQ